MMPHMRKPHDGPRHGTSVTYNPAVAREKDVRMFRHLRERDTEREAERERFEAEMEAYRRATPTLIPRGARQGATRAPNCGGTE